MTTSSINFLQGTSARRQLSYDACKKIERFILVPILKERKLKPFHPLVRSIPTRIVNKQIVCLRDLEKILLWLAPVSPNLPIVCLLNLPIFLLPSSFAYCCLGSPTSAFSMCRPFPILLLSQPSSFSNPPNFFFSPPFPTLYLAQSSSAPNPGPSPTLLSPILLFLLAFWLKLIKSPASEFLGVSVFVSRLLRVYHPVSSHFGFSSQRPGSTTPR